MDTSSPTQHYGGSGKGFNYSPMNQGQLLIIYWGMEEGGGGYTEWQTSLILFGLVSTEQNLVTQQKVAAFLRLWIICCLQSEFLPSSCLLLPGARPGPPVPACLGGFCKGVSKHKMLRVHDSHSPLPCIYRTLWLPPALALTLDFILGEVLQNRQLCVYGGGGGGPLHRTAQPQWCLLHCRR